MAELYHVPPYFADTLISLLQEFGCCNTLIDDGDICIAEDIEKTAVHV